MIIIAVASTVVGIKITRTITEYQYARASTHLFEKLKFAKQLAMVNQSDVNISFSQDKNKVICEIILNGTSNNIDQIKYRHVLTNLCFKFETEKSDIIKNNISFVFTSTGDFYPKGILYLSPAKSEKKDQDKAIDLRQFFSREKKKK